MQPSQSRFHRTSGTTLAEVMIGLAVSSIVVGGLMIGSISLQRSFSASERLARAQADLLRVGDYIARDIRNATNIATTPGSPAVLTITTADYYDRRGTPDNLADDVANSPTLGRTGATYGPDPITVRYVQSGSRILREVRRVDAGATSTISTWVADSVDNFAVTVSADGTATISCASAMPYSIRKSKAQSPTLSFVTASQSRNPTP